MLLIRWAVLVVTAVWVKVLASVVTSSNSMGQYRLNPTVITTVNQLTGLFDHS